MTFWIWREEGLKVPYRQKKRRRLQSKHVLECLWDLFLERATPDYIRRWRHRC